MISIIFSFPNFFVNLILSVLVGNTSSTASGPPSPIRGRHLMSVLVDNTSSTASGPPSPIRGRHLMSVAVGLRASPLGEAGFAVRQRLMRGGTNYYFSVPLNEENLIFKYNYINYHTVTAVNHTSLFI